MPAVFQPISSLTKYVEASSPQPQNTQYRVAIGGELWRDGERHAVIKVQMVYNGKVAGRTSPSYPLGTDDERRVREAIDEVLALHRLQQDTLTC